MSQQAHPRDRSCAARRFWRLALHRNSADSLPVPLKSPSIPYVGKAYASYTKIYTNSAQWQPECLVTGLISRQAHAISERYASAALRKCYAPFRQPLTPSDEAYRPKLAEPARTVHVTNPGSEPVRNLGSAEPPIRLVQLWRAPAGHVVLPA